MADERIEIEIVLDDGSVKKGFANIEKASKKAGKEADKNLASFKKLAKTAALAGAAVAAAFTGKAIQAAARQEDAINNLNTALILAGDSVAETSQEIQDFAAAIERTTKVGDEAVLEQFALARAFARNKDEAKELVTAAIDLSAATGIELSSAVRNLGKTFSGLQGEIGESVSEIRNLTAEELKAGDALDVVAEKFGGAAQAQVSTFSGAITQTGNSLGTFLENIGLLIIRQPIILDLIKSLNKGFNDLADGIKNAFPDTFAPEIERNQKRIDSLNEQIKSLTESQKEQQKVAQRSSGGFLGFSGLTTRTEEIKKLNEEALKPLNEELKQLQNRQNFLNREQAQEDFNLLRQQLNETRLKFDESFNLEKLRQRTAEQLRILTESQQKLNITTAESASIRKQILENAARERLEISKKFATEEEKIQEELKDSLNNILRTGLISGIEAFGAALAKGQNAFDAFGRQILGTLGDFLIKLGTSGIVISNLIESIRTGLQTLFAGGGFVASAAAIALGGALKAFAGTTPGGSSGGTSAASSGGGVTTSDSADLESPIDPAEIAEAQRPTEVNIEVTGQVVDPRGTALQMAELLRDVQDSNGALLVNV